MAANASKHVSKSMRFAVTAVSRRNVSLKNIVYGSPEAKEVGEAELQQHSKIVARSKYLHVFEFHKVKPELSDRYKIAATIYYQGIRSDPNLNVKLTGSWETIIGDTDTFVHITEYENHGGFDRSFKLIRDSHHIKAYNEMLPFLNSRTTQINQEFAFFPSSPPRSQGGIFELRSYQLKPGSLLEWENTWRRGIEARRKLVAPVGAWFSRLGRLHQVHHLWQYPDFETRSEIREKAWQVDGWSDTVHKTSQLAKFMDSTILVPLPFSPLK
ncbi:NIPSNAP-domain-containing [Pyrrhoderma noxium]|uniref:NIPSNAP-domain-containing n=1 Tax=Pyrrhoderma noxium TaxID=2282107 RepID=A0A286UR53_9AGAM|nr:NIPSNAP-domain-containing [Pyrrhoderma noxium]